MFALLSGQEQASFLQCLFEINICHTFLCTQIIKNKLHIIYIPCYLMRIIIVLLKVELFIVLLYR